MSAEEENTSQEGKTEGSKDEAKDAASTPESTQSSEKPSEGKEGAEPALVHATPKDWLLLMGIAGLSAALDLWSKAWALKKLSRARTIPVALCMPPEGAPAGASYQWQRLPLPPPEDKLELVKNYLDFQYAENCGGAWGLLHGAKESLRKPFFLVVTVGAVLFILHMYRTMEKDQRLMKWALPLVLGGAIGNLVDRMRLGYVVDFIHMHWQNKQHWPTYNVADIAISVGIGLMILEYILGPKKAPVQKSETKTATAS